MALLDYQIQATPMSFDGEKEQRRMALLTNGAMWSSVFLVRQNVKRRTPVGSQGALMNQIGGDVMASPTEIRGVVFSPTPYARFVEEGAAPHFIPIAPLKAWAQKHGYAEGFAYWIRFKHAPYASSVKTGKLLGLGIPLKAVHMFAKGFDESKVRIEGFFKKAVERFAKEFKK